MTPPADQGTGRLGDTIIAPLQPPADVHLDDTSDNILKPLAGFREKMTGKLVQPYTRWMQHPSRNLGLRFAPPYGQGDEENRMLNELGGFGFGYLWGAQGRAANLGKAAKAAQDDTAQVKQGLTAAWQGKAADSAAEKLDDFSKASGEYLGTVNGFSQLLQQLWQTVRKPIVDLGQVPENGGQAPKKFLDAHKPEDTDGLLMFMDRLDEAIKWGRQDDNDREVINPRSSSEVARNQEDGTGPINAQDIRSMSVDLDTGYDSKWSDMFCRQMDEYCQQYSDAMDAYRQYIRNAHTAATNALRAFSDGLNVPTDPFGRLQLGADSGGQDKGSSGRNDGGGGDTKPRSSGGGGDTKPQEATAAPQVGPTPAQPQTPPAQPEPNQNPVTHKPLEVDPSTGQPYPIDPRTGEAVKTGHEAPDTVTVQHGDHKITMSEPDDHGKMAVSVGDGTGHDKAYQLDFGDQSDQAPGTAADAAQGDPARPHDGKHDPAQPHDAAGGPVHKQPDGTAPTTDPNQVHRPGPDGKIHIEDGTLDITAERPSGPDGPTVVTVDDGSGEPTKYTLDDHGKIDPATGRPVDGLTAQQHGGGAGSPAEPVEHLRDGQRVVADGGVAAAGHAQPVAEHAAAMPGQPTSGQSAAADGHDPGAGEQTGRHHVQPVAAQADATPAYGTPVASGPDESTTAQSVLDPFSSDPGLGHVPSDPGLGDSAVPAGWQQDEPGHPAELGTAPTTTDQQQGQSMGMMGSPMMGGGQGNSGDQERGTSGYRVDGGLFGTAPGGSRISGSLAEEDEGRR
ncbi:hypothetical protein [Amycolatopsis rubida]|uniref:Proteins of 100 residues with WXG n=1 Tax=Amycolatopsis rubida TaxID=112413 RepID=A0A1I5CZT3_9PSEU|nr:hypothetical protein [Amycolatopsis rubida]SFN92510.1 hypothetical protein SAMN05421854_10148 [Amycolatopsis rubida]